MSKNPEIKKYKIKASMMFQAKNVIELKRLKQLFTLIRHYIVFIESYSIPIIASNFLNRNTE